ncbi:MAG: O-antigen ligase family protein, partial [Calditerrivibrio sp.]|nr:O-antigen ligase family protein [Calditerrivibrio sp.]
SLKMLQDYPVFGIGVGNFKKVFEKYQGEYIYVSRAHAHNAYIQMALNYGIPSVIIMLIIFGALFKRFYNDFRFKNSKWGILGISILVMYMLEGLTENNFTDSEVNMYFWFLMGIIMAKSSINLDEDKGKSIEGSI